MENLKERTVRDLANALITYEGYTRTLKEWCYLLDLDYATVRMRRTRGMDGSELFAKTVHGYNRQGKTIILSDSIFRRLEHHGRRLRMMPTELMHELIEHGITKLDKSEQQNKNQVSSELGDA